MIYVLCALVLLAAVPLTWMLKRDAAQSWRRHQALTQPPPTLADRLTAFRETCISIQIVLTDRFTPAMRKIADELERLRASLRDGDVR